VNGGLWTPRPPRALVVFDVNVYLDVARLMVGNFSWDDFLKRASQHASDPNPHTLNAQIDSLRALAISLTGRYEPDCALEVWFGRHLDDTTFHKLTQAIEGGELPEDCGLGWSDDDANDFLDNFVTRIRKDNSGGFIEGEPVAYKSPPLDHEDGCVLATANLAGTEDFSYEKFCVTRDRGFRTASLKTEITVMYPHEWVAHMRSKLNQGNPLHRMMTAATTP